MVWVNILWAIIFAFDADLYFFLVCFGLISHYEYSSKWLPTCIQTEHSLSFSLTNQVISCVIFHLRQPHKAVYYINLSITPRYTHCSSHI